MDKHKIFIIDEWPLIEALRLYGRGANSKDYEYAVSIHMKRKLEKDYNEPFCIVFDLKPGKDGPKYIPNPTPEETIKILREMLQEDTPVDFGLVRGTVNSHAESAFAFQVKKFYGQSIKNYNADLLTYINKVLKKYKPGEASLIIVPGLEDSPSNRNQSVQLDINFLRKNINVPEGSFQAVFIMTYDNRAVIQQLFPSL